MADNSKPVLKLGGDAREAVSAFRDIQGAMARTRTGAIHLQTGFAGMTRTVRSAFAGMTLGIRSAFQGLRTFGSAIFGIYNRLKWVVLGVGAAIGASVVAWNREAQAQTRLNSILRANVRNYRDAGREIDRLISKTQRRTNFADDDVRNVFGSFMAIMGKGGFGAARQLLPSILDFSAAKQMDPSSVAEMFARSVASGQTGLLSRQGIIVDQRAFKRDPVGQINQAISRVAPGAAAADRRANPIPAFMNNFGDIVEGVGSIFASRLNPAIEKAAQVAQRWAEQLGSDPAGVWSDFKEKAASAWDVVKQLAANTFVQIRAFISAFFRPPGTAGQQHMRAGMAGASPVTSFGQHLWNVWQPKKYINPKTGQPFNISQAGTGGMIVGAIGRGAAMRGGSMAMTAATAYGGYQLAQNYAGPLAKAGVSYASGLLSGGNFGQAMQAAKDVELPFPSVYAQIGKTMRPDKVADGGNSGRRQWRNRNELQAWIDSGAARLVQQRNRQIDQAGLDLVTAPSARSVAYKTPMPGAETRYPGLDLTPGSDDRRDVVAAGANYGRMAHTAARTLDAVLVNRTRGAAMPV